MEQVRVDAFDVLRKLKGSEQLFANPKPLLQMIAEELYRVARVSFETQSAPGGQAWPPLSLRYAKWKSKRFPGRGILRLRGQLIRSLKRGIEKNSAWVSEGPLAHAAVHQYGFNGTVTVPAHTRKIVKRSTFEHTMESGKRKRILRSQGVTQVRAHSRHMRIPARPTMGFPLDSQERVAQDIKDLITAPYGGK